MKIKNKGKVYPSPSSSSSSSSPSNGNHLSLLKLLPASILVFISGLSIDDREVLAYLITRSIKTTGRNASSSSITQRKASSKKTAASGSGNSSNNNNNDTHKPPMFDCDCFDCYTSYWFKWDSSPNRELIHRAIEAFEDHLTNGESDESRKNGKAKRRDKTASRRLAYENQVVVVEDTWESSASAVADSETFPEKEVVVEVSGDSIAVEEEERLISSAAAPPLANGCSHKGLARKMLPDVLGLLNSRLWSLWCPNA